MHAGDAENTRADDREKNNIEATESLVKTCENNNIRVGHLYEKPRTETENNGIEIPRPRAFRQSAFTPLRNEQDISPKPDDEEQDSPPKPDNEGQDIQPKPDDKQKDTTSKPKDEERWTTISLAPTSFFNDTDQWIAPDHRQGWPLHVVHGYSGKVVELYAIIKALRTVENRWRELERYISGLLVQDFMNPKDYCNLLFDDETFSRSRLYFWILGFIIEVQPCIEDNITQWNLYQQARIQPLLDDLNAKDLSGLTKVEKGIAKSITKYDKEGNEIKQDLENLKKRFDAISESVRALRDGCPYGE
ncbi:hypothetical protein N0V85_000682 [Neurospora sp. IMI 360204]|nr:hypothetical protein N0V85_000682 [Neurospora sp. IMI 360204]